MPYDTAFEVLQPSLWVFGYGSLIWNPGFSYVESRKAYAPGFARRMYQGNTYHRGDARLPGRVATLIEHSGSSANGMVFRVDGQEEIDKAIAYLKEREVGNGYEFCMVPVDIVTSAPRVRSSFSESSGESDSSYSEDEEDKLTSMDCIRTMALTCIAHIGNEFYLGPDDLNKMAREICTAKGLAGPNTDYVLNLAANLRKLFPEDHDEHLFELERRIISVRA